MTNAGFSVIGLGESLFDIFPDHQVVGGAPLNVAVHANQLANRQGGRGVVVSRIGQDDLGQRLLDELQKRGMATEFMQTDPDRGTGRVYVMVDTAGQPQYDIVHDVAWDWLQFDPDWEDAARRCEAVCFGSLAQRNSQSRHTIYRFLDATSRRTTRLFDVNLRQSYHDRNVLQRSCQFANAVKLNNEELPIVADTLGIDQSDEDPEHRIHDLITRFELDLLVLTRGAEGTVIHTAHDRHEGPRVEYPAAAAADAVGAGDACAAAVLVGLVLRWPLDRVVELANHAGAFVASQPGGTPVLPNVILDMVKRI